VPGVKTAESSVLGFARVIGKDGKPVGREGNGPPNFGSSIAAEGETIWKISDGRLPTNNTEVALDTETANKGDYKLGDSVKVVAQGGSRDFTLVGLARYGDVASPGGATFALFDLATAQEFVGKPGFIDAVVVKSDGSVSDDVLADRIQAALPTDSQTETLTGAEITKENQNAIEDALSFFRIFLTVFSFIAMGVACFVIYNVFSITAAQRQRENALLRAVGAQRRQVTRAMLIESVVVGIVGSLLGLIVGVGRERFVMPTTGVRESLRPLPTHVHNVQGSPRMVQVRDTLVPLVSLGELFGLPHESDPCKATVVVVEDAGSRVGLVVDALLGKQEVVIKSLGETFASVRGIAGGAILGDGRIGLILDAHGIVELERGANRVAA